MATLTNHVDNVSSSITGKEMIRSNARRKVTLMANINFRI